MHSAVVVGGFLVAATFVSLIWGRVLWYLDERSQAFRRWAFVAMGYTSRMLGEVRSGLLSFIYYGFGLFAAFLFLLVFGLRPSTLISFSVAHLSLAVLGAIGEISLTSLLVDLTCRATGQGGPEQFVEVREIPWIKGLLQLPPSVVPFAAALGGIVEELFFRGVLLRILTDKLLVAPLAAVAITGALFCVQQLIQLRTTFQAMVICCSCVAISFIGGLLVVLSGSLVPAVLSHASFVVFFMTQGNDDSVGFSRSVAKGRPR
jgi:membrane protease YdiL (CAAX protease family)